MCLRSIEQFRHRRYVWWDRAFMDLETKLAILADAAKYDASGASSGTVAVMAYLLFEHL